MDSVRGAQDGQRRRRSSLEAFRLKEQIAQAQSAAEEAKKLAELERLKRRRPSLTTTACTAPPRS